MDEDGLDPSAGAKQTESNDTPMDENRGAHRNARRNKKIAEIEKKFVKTPMQKIRYEKYTKSSLNSTVVKRTIQRLAGVHKVPKDFTPVVAALGKLFVGEVVEQACLVMTEWGDSGPLRPCHLREAHRRISSQKTNSTDIGWQTRKKKLFRRSA